MNIKTLKRLYKETNAMVHQRTIEAIPTFNKPLPNDIRQIIKPELKRLKLSPKNCNVKENSIGLFVAIKSKKCVIVFQYANSLLKAVTLGKTKF